MSEPILTDGKYSYEFINSVRESLRSKHGFNASLSIDDIQRLLSELKERGLLRLTDTLAGIPCLPRATVYTDTCKKCQRHILSVNDRVVSDGCKCLHRSLQKGIAVDARTADIVDALGIQFDDPPTQQQEQP